MPGLLDTLFGGIFTDTSVDAPQVDPLAAGHESLLAQRALAPLLFSLEAQYAPQFARLGFQMANELGFNYKPPSDQEIKEKFPFFANEWERVRSQGDDRSFTEWLNAHLSLNPQDAGSIQYREWEKQRMQEQGVPADAIEQYDRAAQALAQTQASANRIQREADLRDVQQLGGAAREAFEAVNPELAGLRQQIAGDAAAALRQQSAPYYDAILDPGGGRVSAAQVEAAPKLGTYFQTGQVLGQAPQAQAQDPRAARDVQAPLLGDPAAVSAERLQAPMVSAPGPVSAERLQAPMVSAPGPVSAERVQATTVDSPQLGPAAQMRSFGVGQTALGQSTATAARRLLERGGLTDVGQALQAQALAELGRGGELSPEQRRLAEQASAQAFTARGLGQSRAAAIDQVLRVLDKSRELQNERRAFAGGVDAQNLGARGQAQGFALGARGQELGAQTFNAGQQQAAEATNVGARNQFAALGGELALRAGLANQQAGLQAGLANQQAQLAAQQSN
ncbi:MAG: hypothetical protein D6692_10510, partial [Planctomycetota bacterium]